MNDQLLSTLSNDDSSVSPREIVHRPERVEREVEGEDGDGEDIEHHPADHVPLPSEEEDHDLKTVDSSDHDEGKGRDSLSFGGDEVDEVDELKRKEGQVCSSFSDTHHSRSDSRRRRLRER